MTEVLYKSSLTREPFLFYEMRTVCRLLDKGVARDDIVETVEKQNLFQYPTEKSVRRIAKACLARVGCSSAYENSFLGFSVSGKYENRARKAKCNSSLFLYCARIGRFFYGAECI